MLRTFTSGSCAVLGGETYRGDLMGIFSVHLFCSSDLDRFCLGQDMNVYERISFAEKREGSFIGVLMRIVE